MREIGYKHGRPIELDLEPIDDRNYLHAPAAASFRAMREAARAVGVELPVNTAWRDMPWQTRLYDDYVEALVRWDGKGSQPSLVARPGYSNHQAGTAVDIERANHPERDAWLDAHAAVYGWRRTVPSERWHYEWSATPSVS